jgi:hypothetical protein
MPAVRNVRSPRLFVKEPIAPFAGAIPHKRTNPSDRAPSLLNLGATRTAAKRLATQGMRRLVRSSSRLLNCMDPLRRSSPNRPTNRGAVALIRASNGMEIGNEIGDEIGFGIGFAKYDHPPLELDISHGGARKNARYGAESTSQVRSSRGGGGVGSAGPCCRLSASDGDERNVFRGRVNPSSPPRRPHASA